MTERAITFDRGLNALIVPVPARLHGGDQITVKVMVAATRNGRPWLDGEITQDLVIPRHWPQLPPQAHVERQALEKVIELGFVPSVTDLARRIGVTRPSVSRAVQRLIEYRLLTKTERRLTPGPEAFREYVGAEPR